MSKIRVNMFVYGVFMKGLKIYPVVIDRKRV